MSQFDNIRNKASTMEKQNFRDVNLIVCSSILEMVNKKCIFVNEYRNLFLLYIRREEWCFMFFA